MRATVSILGLSSYDEAIWDKLQVPTQAIKEDIIDEIILECSDFELLYPDWDVMRHAIGLWSRKELPIWQRLYDAKELEYNPLWNVDADIKEVRDVTDNSNYSDNTVGSNSRTNETDGTSQINTSEETDSTSSSSGTSTTNASSEGTTLHKSNTFNSGQMIDNYQDDSESSTTSNTTESESTVGNVDTTGQTTGTSHEEGQEQGNYNEDKTGTQARATHDDYHVIRQGNIGVTSSQQLLTEEWEVSQLDPEQYIIDSFKQRFCLLLY